MADIVNLNRARKAKAKRDATVQAAANRAAFGRTKAQKIAEAERQARDERQLDGLQIKQKHALTDLDLDQSE